MGVARGLPMQTLEKMMRKLLFVLALTPSVAFAADEAVECGKKEGVVKCKVNKENVVVDDISVNGGECAVTRDGKLFHHAFSKGDTFVVPVNGGGIPGFDGCSYVRTVTIKTHDGQKKTFGAL
jgi:hypothetical protein